MTSHPVSEELQRCFVGSTCLSVEWLENIWKFEFERSTVCVESCWRIVTSNGVAIASEDDKQYFGLPQPVDAAVQALKLLSKPVVTLGVNVLTADLQIEFEEYVRLEVWNGSSGYEPWNCTTKSGLQIYALGGGKLRIHRDLAS